MEKMSLTEAFNIKNKINKERIIHLLNTFHENILRDNTFEKMLHTFVLNFPESYRYLKEEYKSTDLKHSLLIKGTANFKYIYEENMHINELMTYIRVNPSIILSLLNKKKDNDAIEIIKRTLDEDIAPILNKRLMDLMMTEPSILTKYLSKKSGKNDSVDIKLSGYFQMNFLLEYKPQIQSFFSNNENFQIFADNFNGLLTASLMKCCLENKDFQINSGEKIEKHLANINDENKHDDFISYIKEYFLVKKINCIDNDNVNGKNTSKKDKKKI